MNKPHFMDFALQEWNGQEWVTVAWFVSVDHAIACMETLSGALSHFQVVDTRNGRSYSPEGAP